MHIFDGAVRDKLFNLRFDLDRLILMLRAESEQLRIFHKERQHLIEAFTRTI